VALLVAIPPRFAVHRRLYAIRVALVTMQLRIIRLVLS
jgi:hypothetical protein